MVRLIFKRGSLNQFEIEIIVNDYGGVRADVYPVNNPMKEIRFRVGDMTDTVDGEPPIDIFINNFSATGNDINQAMGQIELTRTFAQEIGDMYTSFRESSDAYLNSVRAGIEDRDANYISLCLAMTPPGTDKSVIKTALYEISKADLYDGFKITSSESLGKASDNFFSSLCSAAVLLGCDYASEDEDPHEKLAGFIRSIL